MKLYDSGPMTALIDFNFPLFDQVRTALEAEGHEVKCPAQHDREVIKSLWPGKRPEDFDGYAVGDITRYFDAVTDGGTFTLANLMAWDLDIIVNWADAIVMLPGWEKSSGALSERYAAESLNKPVYLWNIDQIILDEDQQLVRKALRKQLAQPVLAVSTEDATEVLIRTLRARIVSWGPEKTRLFDAIWMGTAYSGLGLT